MRSAVHSHEIRPGIRREVPAENGRPDSAPGSVCCPAQEKETQKGINRRHRMPGRKRRGHGGDRMRTEGPLFHMHEVTGETTRIVKKFLEEQQLTDPELDKLRCYVHQWVDGMQRKPPNWRSILHMSQDELGRYCHDTLLNWGIDPF